MTSRSTGLTVAAFDFDATLTRRDSVVPFLRRIAGSGSLAVRLMRRTHRIAPAIARRDRDQLRTLATESAFAGRSVADVERHAQEYGEMLARTGLRPDTAARLAWHRAEGHRVVIVSASYAHYLDVVGRELGVDAVLATQLEVCDGFCTGRLDGRNCRGPEKALRLGLWFETLGVERASVILWAYGDSTGDRELLAMADHPIWVKRPLASVAPTV